ncbi:MAG: TrkH family potassium uptake protein [Clostridia bacterium]|nr:TrkH family potassium uptake protein [Clostridia bacterium]
MNILLLLRVLGSILLVEGAAMVPALAIALVYGDGDALAFVWSILILAAIGVPLRLLCKPEQSNLRAREGFLAVALAWILLSVFGALPYLFSGVIPDFIDALFESVSGFTTTGASIMPVVEGQPHGVMFWRSFTHWIGGMGVLVLTLALLPQMSGRTSHLVRAESPGPTLSKIAPRMGDTAKILYIVYGVLTLMNWIALMLAGMDAYDAAIHALGTAGTGGFSNYAASVGHFNSAWIEGITTFFMIVFGVNFALYYKALTGGWREAIRNEELRWFLGIYIGVVLLITLNLMPDYEGNFLTALRYSSFQTASLMSTTGYATANFAFWPVTSKALLMLVMFTGGCAGSTAGGMKICRIGMLCKLGIREVRRTFQPRKVHTVRFEGKAVEESVLGQIAVYAFMCLLILVLGTVLVSLENPAAELNDLESSFTAALTCFNNVGPGLSNAIGPAGSYASYGPFAKLVLTFLMLAGRLEIFPMLALFHPAMWRK